MKYTVLFFICITLIASAQEKPRDLHDSDDRDWCGKDCFSPPWAYCDWDCDEEHNQTICPPYIGIQETNVTVNTTGLGNCSCNCSCDCVSCNCSCLCDTPLVNLTVDPPGNETNETCPKKCNKKGWGWGRGDWVEEGIEINNDHQEFEELNEVGTNKGAV